MPLISVISPCEVVTHSLFIERAIASKEEVVVIGAGASAVDTAAMLHQSGADVEIIARHAVNLITHPFPVFRLMESPEASRSPDWTWSEIASLQR